jgi:hypothetical protein
MFITDRRFCPPPARPLFFLAMLLLAAVGCHRNPYACVPVSGKVTYEDGTLIPADRIRLTFISQSPQPDPKVQPRPGMATVDVKNGEFKSVTTYTANDGIVAGEHKVLVMCYIGREMRTDLVDKDYADSNLTPLTVKSSESPFELKVKKPRSQ